MVGWWGVGVGVGVQDVVNFSGRGVCNIISNFFTIVSVVTLSGISKLYKGGIQT